jgi:glutathione synthase/RimK-type ligase-like ATP-grasp enzyme
MIGIIFSSVKLKRIIAEKERYENANFYIRFAEENEVDLFLYTIKSMTRTKNKVLGYRYLHQEKKFIPEKNDIPKVNLIRTVIRKIGYDQLKEIEEKKQVLFTNLVRGRDKYRIYKYLSCIKSVNDHIPETETLSYENIESFLKKFHHIVIKPVSGAMGKKICVVERSQRRYVLNYTYKGKNIKKEIPIKRFPAFLKRNFPFFSAYIIQKYIPFQTYEGEKFDIRTSVQKGKDDHWRVTGIVTRVAGKDGIVTNVAQGGRVVPFKEVNCTLAPETKSKVYDFSLNIAKELENLYPSLIDLGLDIAIDRQGHLWFIEANYCDQRYAYREAKNLDMWEASYRTPFEYAYAEYIKIMNID